MTAWLLTLAIAGVAVAIRLYLLDTTHRTAEDFYITLRYAENLAHGRGFVYNAGEHVLGTTTPLYTLFLALAARVGLDATLCGKLVNIAADAATCLLTVRLAAAARRPGYGLVAAALYAVWPPAVLWSISGMETSLVTAATLAVFVAAAERRPYTLAGSAAALALLRVDGLLAAVVAFTALGWENRGRPEARRTWILALALFAALLAPWLAFALSYFGSAVPTSLVAKLHVYAWQRPGPLPNVRPFLQEMLPDPRRNPAYLLLMIGIPAGLWRVATQVRTMVPAVIWMALYYAAMACSSAFLFGWYFVPPVPVYALVSVAGWAAMLQYVARRMSGGDGGEGPGPAQARECRPARFAVAAAALVLIAGIATVPRQRAMLAANQRAEAGLLEMTGLALRGIVPHGERLMLEPIGYIGYFSGARILDAVGLVSPEVIPFFRPGAASPYLDILATLKPGFVLLRAGEQRALLAVHVPPDRELIAHYELVRTFANPANPASEPAFYLYQRVR